MSDRHHMEIDNRPIVSSEEVFDPLAALEAQGVTLPEPIEIEVPEQPAIDLNDPAWRAVVEEARENYVEPGELIEDTGNPKDLIGATKPDLSLVPMAGMLLTSQAMMDGAAKYGPYNWRDNPVKMRVYIAAAMRHLGQLLDGEDFDPISGVHHVGHASACMAIISDAIMLGNIIDDRPAKGPAGDMIRRFGDTQSFKTSNE